MKPIENTDLVKELTLQLMLLGFTKQSEDAEDKTWQLTDKKIFVKIDSNYIKVKYKSKKYRKNLTSNYANVEAAIPYLNWVIENDT